MQIGFLRKSLINSQTSQTYFKFFQWLNNQDLCVLLHQKTGSKSKPSSAIQCLPFSNINKYVYKVENEIIMPASASALDVLTSLKKFKYRETAKTMYNDVRAHVSQFIRKTRDRSSKPSSSYDVQDHQSEDDDVSRPSFNYNVHDHQSEDDDVSRPSYDVQDHQSKDDDVSRPSFSYNVQDHQSEDDDKSRPSFSYDVHDDDKSRPSFIYQCYPFSKINKCHCEDGNKIIMPASALDKLMSMTDIEFPMTFKIINPLLHKFSHCGVLEFSGEEGNVYLPNWMMNSLLLQQGQVVNIEYTALSKGTFLKIQPHSTKFIMNLSDPKEAMERILKDFACATIGDTIMVNHRNQSYYLNIVEVRPKNAVSLFETDCELEFTETLDHKEPEKLEPKVEQVKEVKDAESLEKDAVFRPFTGASRRLNEDDTKLVRELDHNCSAAEKKAKTEDTADNIEVTKFQPFTGKKHTLLSC